MIDDFGIFIQVAQKKEITGNWENMIRSIIVDCHGLGSTLKLAGTSSSRTMWLPYTVLHALVIEIFKFSANLCN